MILHLKEGIVAEGRVLRNTIFGPAEIKDIAVSPETPVLEARDLKPQVSAVLITQTRGLGESIAESIVEIGRVIAVEGY